MLRKEGTMIVSFPQAPPPSLFKNVPLLFSRRSEYTITMYDTKSRELRWNATYSDYASTLPDDDTKYSETLKPAPPTPWRLGVFERLGTLGAPSLMGSFVFRDGPLCVQRRRAGGDGGQRVGRRPVGAELQLPSGGHVHLAARGPAQGPSHQRGRGDPALPHLHVRRGRPHHAVEVPLSSGEEAKE